MKQRITVTVDAELLRAAQRRAGKRSRSRAIEDALRAAERLAIARETIEYYRSLGPDERAEDATWGEIAACAAAAAADEDEAID